LGEVSTKNIIQHMMKNDSLKWEENRKKCEVFADALRNILGQSSVFIENLVLEGLYSKLNLKIEEKKGYEFSDYIKELRKRCDR